MPFVAVPSFPITDSINAAIYALRGDWTSAGLTFAGVIPYVGDMGKALKWGRRFNKHQGALVDLAKQVKRKGLTTDEAKIMKEWAEEYGVIFMSHEGHIGRKVITWPHYHIGPVDHIPHCRSCPK